MVDDAALLRQYSESGSEAAFTELVGRHLQLVYYTAWRQVGGDAALAQDVAQSVFSIAARKARDLASHLTLTGWLYTTTRHTAFKAVRKQQTRRRHEQDAAMHELTTAEPAREWERLRPIIDEALSGLDQRDREAILIRFFEDRAFADMGAILRISEDAARMRVDRALDKLRPQLARRGIQSASAALAIALGTQGGLAVPAGMVAAVSSAAVATGAAAGGAAMLLGFMSTTKTTVAVTAVAAVLATGFGIVERNRAQGAESRLAAVTQDQASLRTRLVRAEKGLLEAETRAAEADRDSGTLLAAVEAARAKAVPRPPTPVSTTAGRTAVNDALTLSLQAIFPSGIVVTVGEKTITVDDVRREIAPLIPKLQHESRDPDEFSHRLNRLQNTVIKDLVDRILLIKEFSNAAVTEGKRHIPPTYVENAMADRMRDKFGNDPSRLLAHLESQGLTPDQYRKTIEEDIIYYYMRGQQRRLDSATKEAKAR